MSQPGSSGGDGARLSQLRAARLRTRAVRGGLVKLAFGTLLTDVTRELVFTLGPNGGV